MAGVVALLARVRASTRDEGVPIVVCFVLTTFTCFFSLVVRSVVVVVAIFAVQCVTRATNGQPHWFISYPIKPTTNMGWYIVH